jgi:hypothetical protein
MNAPIALYAAALKITTLPCAVARDGNSYCLRLPSKITPNGGIEALSDVKLLNFGNMNKMRIRMESISRYEAQAYPDSEVVYIRPRDAMKSPKWGSRFGALPELSRAMKKAGLI